MQFLRRLTRRFDKDAGVKHDVRRLTRGKAFSDASVKSDVRRLTRGKSFSDASVKSGVRPLGL